MYIKDGYVCYGPDKEMHKKVVEGAKRLRKLRGKDNDVKLPIVSDGNLIRIKAYTTEQREEVSHFLDELHSQGVVTKVFDHFEPVVYHYKLDDITIYIG